MAAQLKVNLKSPAPTPTWTITAVHYRIEWFQGDYKLGPRYAERRKIFGQPMQDLSSLGNRCEQLAKLYLGFVFIAALDAS